MNTEPEPRGDSPSRQELVAVLAENGRAFLSFLERRVGGRELAEDVLQDAFARSLDKLPATSEESAVAWFYRVLRNAVVDHYRRGGASERALAALARKLDEHGQPRPRAPAGWRGVWCGARPPGALPAGA